MKPKNRIKPAEPDTSEEQTQQSEISEQKAQPVSSNAVFLMRAKGMPFDEFKKVCIQSLREAGLIKD